MKNPVVEKSVKNSALSVIAAELNYGPISINAVLEAILGKSDVRYCRIDGRNWYSVADAVKSLGGVYPGGINSSVCHPDRIPRDCVKNCSMPGSDTVEPMVNRVGLLIMLLRSTSAKAHPMREWVARALDANSQDKDSGVAREHLNEASAALRKAIDALDALAEKVKKG